MIMHFSTKNLDISSGKRICDAWKIYLKCFLKYCSQSHISLDICLFNSLTEEIVF